LESNKCKQHCSAFNCTLVYQTQQTKGLNTNFEKQSNMQPEVTIIIPSDDWTGILGKLN